MNRGRNKPHTRERSGGWGGARTNAGRPARGAIASEPHKTRPALAARHPVLVRARIAPALGSLRRLSAYAALRRAVAVSLARDSFRIVRLALRDGVHGARIELVVEADDRVALARGVQGFCVSAARALNRAHRRRGTVFPDRYRPTTLRTRAAVRAALAALPSAHAETGLPAAPASPVTYLARVELARASATMRAGP